MNLLLFVHKKIIIYGYRQKSPDNDTYYYEPQIIFVTSFHLYSPSPLSPPARRGNQVLYEWINFSFIVFFSPY